MHEKQSTECDAKGRWQRVIKGPGLPGSYQAPFTFYQLLNQGEYQLLTTKANDQWFFTDDAASI